MVETDKNEIRLRGIAVSEGIVIGQAFLPVQKNISFSSRKIQLEEIEDELVKYYSAIKFTEKELDEEIAMLDGALSEKYLNIFRTYKIMLNDPSWHTLVEDTLRKELHSIEYAYSIATGKLISQLSSANNENIRARSQDVHEIAKKVMGRLVGSTENVQTVKGNNLIYVSANISPSTLAHLDKTKFSGIALNGGSKTSHTAILARAFDIPTIVGLIRITNELRNGEMLIIDGEKGDVIIHPSPQTVKRYKLKRKKKLEAHRQLLKIAEQAAITKDGIYFRVSANIEIPEEVEAALFNWGEGIGLYRTEFFYLDRKDFPEEEEQYKNYKYVAERMFPMEVIIRTMDIGGDKFLEYLDIDQERNPDLGLRAIRFSLRNPDIFKKQLRAIVRANEKGNVKLIFPMISGLTELQQAKSFVKNTVEELLKEGYAVNMPEIGIMIEVPSAVIVSDRLAAEVDFFSIGTNDLVQYTLAAERGNANIAGLYSPYHPAIIRLLTDVVNNAHKNGIWVGVCGAIAGDPLFTMFLIGLGIDEFSMASYDIPLIKSIIRDANKEECELLAKKMLRKSKKSEIKRLAVTYLRKLMGDNQYIEYGL